MFAVTLAPGPCADPLYVYVPGVTVTTGVACPIVNAVADELALLQFAVCATVAVTV